MSEHQWNGRDVEFIEFDIATGEQVLDAAASADHAIRSRAVYIALVHSARYVDDGTPVFASIAEVRALPFRLFQRVQRLASAAAEKNQMQAEDPDSPLPDARADVPASARAGNGAVSQ